jgi:hypothetical protein
MKPITPISSISPDDLARVTGGFLGALLGAVGPIMQGVTGIIGAAKGGGGGGGGGGAPAGGGAPPSAAGPAPSGPSGSVSADGLTKITNNVSIS